MLVHEARRPCPDVKLVQADYKFYVEYHHGYAGRANEE